MATATKGTRATPTTPRLSEVARHLVIPDGIVTSVWPRVERRLASAGVRFDPWQQGFSSAALGCRADGLYAASIGGVVESIPRQVGKTFKDGNLVIGLAAEFPGLRVAWTSHHLRTTTNTFQKMQGLVGRPKMRPLIAAIRKVNGEQEIRFKNGSLIMFGARSEGFGRGMDEIDVLVFDEAQILGLKALEDMVPATNQAKNPHGGLVFLLGTPPRPSDDGEAFAAMRRAALNGESKDRMYVEIAADPDARWDDRDQWRKMNPSYPHRTPETAMLRMREMIPDEDSWLREAMGIWDEEAAAGWEVWTRAEWRRTTHTDDGEPKDGRLTGTVTLAVEMPPDRSQVTIGAGGDCRGGGFAWDVIWRGRGETAAVAKLAELKADESKPVGRIVIDKKSPAGSLIAPLSAEGIDVHEVTFDDVAKGTGQFFDAVLAGAVAQQDRDEINEAAEHCTKRTYGDAFLLDRRTGVDISPVNVGILCRIGHQLGPVAPAATEPDFLVL